MFKVTLNRHTNLNRDFVFKLSTDIQNFSKLLPKYFQSLTILNSVNSELLVEEKISFIGRSIRIKTKHIVHAPNFHSIRILDGPLKDSLFTEFYEPSRNGTNIRINVQIKFNGLLKLFSLFPFLIENRINKVMDEFILACEFQKNSPKNVLN